MHRFAALLDLQFLAVGANAQHVCSPVEQQGPEELRVPVEERRASWVFNWTTALRFVIIRYFFHSIDGDESSGSTWHREQTSVTVIAVAIVTAAKLIPPVADDIFFCDVFNASESIAFDDVKSRMRDKHQALLLGPAAAQKIEHEFAHTRVAL